MKGDQSSIESESDVDEQINKELCDTRLPTSEIGCVKLRINNIEAIENSNSINNMDQAVTVNKQERVIVEAIKDAITQGATSHVAEESDET